MHHINKLLAFTLLAASFGFCAKLAAAAGNGPAVAQEVLAMQAVNFQEALRAVSVTRPETLMQVADMYRLGIGIKKNIKEAFKYYNEASKLNYGPAQERIAQFYLSGIGIQENKEKGIMWLHRAAKNGSKEAMIQLSVRYKIGNGVEQSETHYNYWKTESENLENISAITQQNTPHQAQNIAPAPAIIKRERPDSSEFDKYGIGNL